MWWPLTLTYICKVILPWLGKSYPHCNVFSSRPIIFLTWDPIWLNSVGNHEVAGVSSERRRSSCSSLSLLCKYSLVVIIDIYFVKQLVHINRKRTHETSLLAIFKGNQFVSKRALIRKMYHCYHVIMHIFCPTAIADGPQGQPPSPYERHFGSDEGEWAQSSAIS